jgi:hypothetical protein
MLGYVRGGLQGMLGYVSMGLQGMLGYVMVGFQRHDLCPLLQVRWTGGSLQHPRELNVLYTTRVEESPPLRSYNDQESTKGWGEITLQSPGRVGSTLSSGLDTKRGYTGLWSTFLRDLNDSGTLLTRLE